MEHTVDGVFDLDDLDEDDQYVEGDENFPIDMDEIRKEKPLSEEGCNVAIIRAWLLDNAIEKLNKLNARIVNGGFTLISIENRSILFRYTFFVFYKHVSNKRIPHPVQNTSNYDGLGYGKQDLSAYGSKSGRISSVKDVKSG